MPLKWGSQGVEEAVVGVVEAMVKVVDLGATAAAPDWAGAEAVKGACNKQWRD